MHGPQGGDRLMAEIYGELRRLARAYMARLPAGSTLQPTALVHEAYLRLSRNPDVSWNGPGHFFGAAAQSMRQILVDQARRKAARKHGGGLERVDMGSDEVAIDPPDQDMLDLDRALDLLQQRDPRAAQIVSLRFFAGLSAPETANALGISLSTVERDWRFSRAFLRSILKSGTTRDVEW